MPPRNLKAYEEGQAVQTAVKAMLAAHPPLGAPLTAKAINARLPPHLRRSERDIRHHMQVIRKAHDCRYGNVSADLASAT
ncbi:MAG: hypothetical protein ACLPTF_10155 [Steroidobacteraceae bacterium]